MVAKCKSSSKDQQSNSNPFNIGMIFAIFLFENCFSCIWDLSNSWGCKWISSIWKPFCGTLWVPSWNIIFYLKSVFQYSSNIFYLKNKLHYRLSSIWKVVLITIPQSKKLKKNHGFWPVFHRPPPPRKARVPKYLRPGPTSGGTLALSSSGGHPGPGVNVLLILDNFPAKNTKNGSGTKDFQIEDIPKIIPLLRGLFLDFWSFELLLHSAISSIWKAFGRTPKKHLLFEIIPENLL